MPSTKPATQVEVASGFAQLHVSLASYGDAYLLFWSLGSWCCAQMGVRLGSANATSVCPSSISGMHVHLTWTVSEL